MTLKYECDSCQKLVPADQGATMPYGWRTVNADRNYTLCQTCWNMPKTFGHIRIETTTVQPQRQAPEFQEYTLTVNFGTGRTVPVFYDDPEYQLAKREVSQEDRAILTGTPTIDGVLAAYQQAKREGTQR